MIGESGCELLSVTQCILTLPLTPVNTKRQYIKVSDRIHSSINYDSRHERFLKRVSDNFDLANYIIDYVLKQI